MIRLIKTNKSYIYNAVIALSVLLSPNLGAEILPAFFEKDSARTVFEGSINITEQKQAEMLIPKKSLKLKKKKEKSEVKASLKIEKNKIEDRRLAQPTNKEEILKTFGDPSSPYPVAATNEAPAPFKGLMAALSAGDEELAFKYAVQYAKYQEELKDKTTKATAFLGQAKRKVGYLPEGSWPDSQDYAEYAYLQDLDIDDTKKDAHASESNEERISEIAKDLINKINQSKHELFEDKNIKLEPKYEKWGEEERLITRQKYQGKIISSKDGSLDMFVFIKENDQNSQFTISSIERLLSEQKKNNLLNVAVFSIDRSLSTAGSLFKKKYNFSGKVLPGRALASRLKIAKTPSIVFSNKQGESFIVSENLNYYQIDELRKMIQEGK